MHNDHNDVRSAGSKGLFSALSRSDLENGRDDEDVGDEDQTHGDENHQYADDQSQDLIDSNVNAREFHHWPDVAEEMGYLFGTKGQPEHS